MNKNLKKVISATAALTLSASSFAAFAVSFPDVEDTASYAQAVQELSALDIISGYEDGTFKADNLVTRAEITKMIVDARNEGKAAAAAGSSTKFSDSTGHWAAGYISTGVTDGFISGYSDTEFGPDDNVTYVQAQKMLVAAVGYDTYAQANGGWPGGYKMYANSLEITDGISANDDDQLTRAQVAQMIDNAMDTPLCIIDKYENQVFGPPQPVYVTKDGEGKDYQTLFTEKHKAYKVYGRVTDTSKTASIDNDKVLFRVEKADNFDKKYIKPSDVSEDDAGEEMYIGDSKADEQMSVYSQALIQKNDDDEFTIISITPAAANKTVTVAAEDVDTRAGKSSLENKVLYFYAPGTTKNSTKYELADSVTYYVNGVKMGDFYDAAEVKDNVEISALDKYIVENETASVTLQKTANIGTTTSSSKYDTIFISTYETAVVSEVVEKSDEIIINFDDKSSNISQSRLTLDTEDEDLTYSFVLDGKEIEPTELEANDVLSIAYDTDDFANSDFYNVIVSRDTVDDVKCTGVNSDGDEYTIGGVKYKIAQGMQESLSIDTKTTYTLFLDHFGRIAAIDESATSRKFGILKSVYDSGDSTKAKVITAEGAEVEYSVKDSNADAYKQLVTDTDAATSNKKEAYAARVIDYKVNSSNEITINNAKKASDDSDLLWAPASVAEAEAYKESGEKIGSVRLSSSTIILDISDVEDSSSDYRVISMDNLVNEATYTAYGFDKSTNDSTCKFVVITEGDNGFGNETQLAIFVDKQETEDEEGNEVDALTIVHNGEEPAQIIVDDSVAESDYDSFEEGDVFVYSTNSSGYINTIYPVFKGLDAYDSFTEFKNDVFDGTAKLDDGQDKDGNIDYVNSLLSGGEKDDEVEVVLGAVVNRKNNTVVIDPIKTDDDGNKYVDLGVDSVIINDDTKMYTYNFDINKKKQSRIVLDNGIQVTPNVKAAYPLDPETNKPDTSSDTYYIDAPEIGDDVVLAIARVIDGDTAGEIYFIVNE